MRSVEDRFEEMFQSWSIRLPEGAVERREPGRIQKAGWLIMYCFGCDGSREYMDYYAAHRMTNDRHERLFDDGDSEGLPTIETMRRVSSDPVEDAALKQAFDVRNVDVFRMLQAKGFGF